MGSDRKGFMFLKTAETKQTRSIGTILKNALKGFLAVLPKWYLEAMKLPVPAIME